MQLGDVLCRALVHDTKLPVRVSIEALQVLASNFEHTDPSVENFVRGIKYCLFTHYFHDPLSVLCCWLADRYEVDALEQQLRLDPDLWRQISALPSVARHGATITHSVNHHVTSQAAMLAQWLSELDAYHACFSACFNCFLEVLELSGVPTVQAYLALQQPKRQLHERLSNCLQSPVFLYACTVRRLAAEWHTCV